MEVEINEDDLSRSVFIDKNDICVYCEQQYGCPLIECLSSGLVEAISGGIKVTDCAHFKMFDR